MPAKRGTGPVRRPTAMKNRVLHILIPDVISDDDSHVRNADERWTHNSEKEDYIVELKTLATDLQFEPKIHRMKISNIPAEVDEISSDELIMNLCDGSDIDGVPGPSVAAYLESRKHPNVVGCDSLFIQNTLTKNGMKKIFVDNLVSCPVGFACTKQTDLETEVYERAMVYPLFVKVSDSYGSVGLEDSSVCHDLEQLKTRCQFLLQQFDNLTVEEFIDGPEFSVLISGNCRDENWPVIVYPPAERAFNKELPRFQRFISFIRNWDEAALAHQYKQVDDANDVIALQDLARRAYIAVSGNCYGRVDIRKRDVNGKFYVLEVNASCGLGKGSSSEFILHLAGQTTKDFFQILLSSALRPFQEELEMTGEPESLDDELVEEPHEHLDKVTELPTSPLIASAVSIIPPEVEKKVNRLMKHPSLAICATPIIHVVVSAVLEDAENCIPDPEGKLAHTWGKDAEYVSELENIFRSIGFDPIVHLYHVDFVDEILGTLSKEHDLIFNACLGEDGREVATMVERHGFKHTLGLNARFFEQSRARLKMRELLAAHRLKIPKGLVVSKTEPPLDELESALQAKGIYFPVNVKPVIARGQEDGDHSGIKIGDIEMLRAFLTKLWSSSLPSASPEAAGGDQPPQPHHYHQQAIVEEFIMGHEYRVLVAGDARDPTADLIVFPPVQNMSATTNASAAVTTGGSGMAADKVQNRLSAYFSLWLGGANGATTMAGAANSKANGNKQKPDVFRPMKLSNELMLQMDLQDLARRAYVAVHGSCYGLVNIVEKRTVDEPASPDSILETEVPGADAQPNKVDSTSGPANAAAPADGKEKNPAVTTTTGTVAPVNANATLAVTPTTASTTDDESPSAAVLNRGELYVVGVSADVRFGENAKAGTVLSLAGSNAEALFAWLLQRAAATGAA
ncbi:hypothetical protein HK102_000223 [Quaeritorhiza haematococci]|nr:hypothetical protein HK102_000223 [Quaeritorhiza haematococci]